MLTLRPYIAIPEGDGDERVRGFLDINGTLDEIYIGHIFVLGHIFFDFINEHKIFVLIGWIYM